MKKILFIMISVLIPHSIYLDINMSNISSINGINDTQIKQDNFFTSTSLLGFDYNFFTHEPLFIDLGISYTIVPLYVRNVPYYLDYNVILPDDTNLYIANLYIKPSIKMDDKLLFWCFIGFNNFNSDYIQLIDNLDQIPIHRINFDTNLSYGLGIDYKMNNKLYAGFNFIYYNSKVDAFTEYQNLNQINFDINLTVRSIRLGYYF